MANYERDIIDLINNAQRQASLKPLVLGGVSGGAGGTGGPPGGIIGYLPQTNVAYDESELSEIITSGEASLLDNLNHIRYRLDHITVSGGGGPESDPIFTASEAYNFATGDKSKLDGIESGANNYSLPTASDSVLGGIKVGTGLEINSGVLSATGTSGGSDYFNPNSFTLGTYDDHFSTGSLDGSWSVFNPSTMTVNTVDIPHCVVLKDIPSGTDNIRGIIKESLPYSADWRITIRILNPMQLEDNLEAGIFVTDDPTGLTHLDVIYKTYDAASNSFKYYAGAYDDSTTLNWSTSVNYVPCSYLRITWDYSQFFLSYEFSEDGALWNRVAYDTEPIHNYPPYIGLFVNNKSGVTATVAFDWFKVEEL